MTTQTVGLQHRASPIKTRNGTRPNQLEAPFQSATPLSWAEGRSLELERGVELVLDLFEFEPPEISTVRIIDVSVRMARVPIALTVRNRVRGVGEITIATLRCASWSRSRGIRGNTVGQGCTVGRRGIDRGGTVSRVRGGGFGECVGRVGAAFRIAGAITVAVVSGRYTDKGRETGNLEETRQKQVRMGIRTTAEIIASTRNVSRCRTAANTSTNLSDRAAPILTAHGGTVVTGYVARISLLALRIQR